MSSDGVNLAIVGLLIVMVMSVLTVAGLIFLFVVQTRANKPAPGPPDQAGEAEANAVDRSIGSVVDTLGHWLVVGSTNVDIVRNALGLHNSTRCSWGEGFARQSEHSLFISAAFQGWTLVAGRGLPNPLDDPDACFHFMTRISKEFNEAQFFCRHRAVGYHGWVRAKRGRISRAYCWGGETLWNQGTLSEAEKRVGMKCLGYGQSQDESASWAEEHPLGNTDRVPQLAAEWSFDPGSVEAEKLWASGCIMGELIPSRSHGA